MNADDSLSAPTFAKGQLWRVDNGYVEIVDLGMRLIHYRLLRHPAQRAAITRLLAKDDLARYLNLARAELVEGQRELAA